MFPARLITLLVIVILGSIAAMELFKFLLTILPLLVILTLVSLLFSGWVRHRKK